MGHTNEEYRQLIERHGLNPDNYLVIQETETELIVFDWNTYKKRVLRKEIEVDFVYMKVTKDKYEYPLEMADSVSELARITGEHVTTIYHNINRKNGKYKKVDLRDVGE